MSSRSILRWSSITRPAPGGCTGWGSTASRRWICGPRDVAEKKPYNFHFPDGNASVARLLTRSLIPASAPGKTAEDIVTAKFDYSRLDENGSPIRIRLNSPVVRVRHLGDPASAKEVEVTYAQRGKTYLVRGKVAVLACYNEIIPTLCPEMPAQQKRALGYGSKVPLIYTTV